MSASPTSRTLAWCKERGWLVGVVERFIPQTKRRNDLFGFIDIVVLDGQPGVLGIQATSTGNMSARAMKIQEECTEAAKSWLDAGNRIWVVGWAKRGAKGKRKLWTPRIREVQGCRSHGVPSTDLACSEDILSPPLRWAFWTEEWEVTK